MESQYTFLIIFCGYGGLDVLYATLSKETSTKTYGKLE